MIRPEDIAGYSPELRELLGFSCFYLAAADEKFSSTEQEWIDAHFGEGAADRFTAHYLGTEWPAMFDRVKHIVRHSLSDSEKQIVVCEARDWLHNFIAADGLEPEEQARLDEFYQWLEEVGLPKKGSSIHSLATKPDPSKTIRISRPQRDRKKALPQIEQLGTKRRKQSWRPKSGLTKGSLVQRMTKANPVFILTALLVLGFTLITLLNEMFTDGVLEKNGQLKNHYQALLLVVGFFIFWPLVPIVFEYLFSKVNSIIRKMENESLNGFLRVLYVISVWVYRLALFWYVLMAIMLQGDTIILGFCALIFLGLIVGWVLGILCYLYDVYLGDASDSSGHNS